MGNNDRIQEIKQRHEAATPGPWTHSRWAPGYVVTDDDKFDVVASVFEYREDGTIEKKFCGEKSLANREFIAHAPEDIAYLLSEVERLQTDIKAMKEALEWTRKHYEEEWTYVPGVGEIVEEIIMRFEQGDPND